MKLKDIADMEQYLNERCYCPGEIYDLTGFFFQVFSPETECVKIDAGERGAIHGTFVSAKCDNESHPQIIYIEITDGHVDSCTRIDDTDNNRCQILKFLSGHIDKMQLDEYTPQKTKSAVKEILDMADAIMA